MAPSEPGELRKFLAPEFIFGDGVLELAGQYAKKLGAGKVLVVSDPGVIAAGWTDRVMAGFKEAGLKSALFRDVTSNPRATEVMAGAEVWHREGCDGLIAVGGGSSIDCAKGIGVVASNGCPIIEFAGVDQIGEPMPPLVCVPTTDRGNVGRRSPIRHYHGLGTAPKIGPGQQNGGAGRIVDRYPNSRNSRWKIPACSPIPGCPSTAISR